MLSLLILAIACLPQFISSSNLALTFDAANNSCTAACTTCSDTSNTDTNQYSTDDELLNELLNATRNNGQDIQEIKQKMDGIISSLSHIKETATSNAGAINDILLLVEDLIMLHNDSSSFSPIPTSCQEIKNKQPNSPSGVYLLATNDGTKHTYCNMEELCGSGGGWTRLAYLDMTDATVNCPSGFGLYNSGGVKACGKPSLFDGCVSVQFPSNGISYSQVCGRVTGYQYGIIEALDTSTVTGAEGVTISHGPSQQHIWSLIAGKSESTASSHDCPCNTGSTVSVPASIGNNYFCESGNPNSSPSQILYTADPLWDGQGCTSLEAACCNAPGLPWFHRDYGNTTTTDYIELRVCGNYPDEDSPVSYYEIYVK